MSNTNWGTCPFIEYLNEVDSILEEQRGTTSIRDELDYIASCQEENVSPDECAEEIMEGNAWAQ
jgi:hypothetical protein